MNARSSLSMHTGPLDGSCFHGVVLERGKSTRDDDTLTFEAGRFRSSACDRYGYGDGRLHVNTGAARPVVFSEE